MWYAKRLLHTEGVFYFCTVKLLNAQHLGRYAFFLGIYWKNGHNQQIYNDDKINPVYFLSLWRRIGH